MAPVSFTGNPTSMPISICVLNSPAETFELATKIHKGHKKRTVGNAESGRTQSLRLLFSVERLSLTVLHLFAQKDDEVNRRTVKTAELATKIHKRHKNKTRTMRFPFVSSVPFCG